MSELKSLSFSRMVARRFQKDRIALICFFMILVLFLIAIFAPLLAGNKPIMLRFQGKLYFPAVFSYRQFVSTDFKQLAETLKPPDYALLPPVPYSPTEYNLLAVLSPPSQEHWLGTDDRGRDVLSRMVWGSRVSLSVGFVAVGIYVLIGIILGALAESGRPYPGRPRRCSPGPIGAHTPQVSIYGAG